MIQEIKCKYCDTKFKRIQYGNYSVRCPHCHRSLEHLSDYGFGPVTPFYISVGENVVGIVKSSGTQYFLEFQGEQITLKKKYLEAVNEAEEYITETLQIGVKEVDIDIITKRGSLFFFGESFGRPYDNIHKVRNVNYDGELLEIQFDQGEKLIVYNPVDITSNEKELKIRKASKVKWSYIPYGNYVTRKVITYVWENNRVRKYIDEEETFCECENMALAVLLEGY